MKAGGARLGVLRGGGGGHGALRVGAAAALQLLQRDRTERGAG